MKWKPDCTTTPPSFTHRSKILISVACVVACVPLIPSSYTESFATLARAEALAPKDYRIKFNQGLCNRLVIASLLAAMLKFPFLPLIFHLYCLKTLHFRFSLPFARSNHVTQDLCCSTLAATKMPRQRCLQRSRLSDRQTREFDGVWQFKSNCKL